MEIFVVSPPALIKDEAVLINQLFEKGIQRYHLNKEAATEQSLAEILEKVNPQYLSKITLHSHYHLVLAYGVGGIHFSKIHRQELKEDFESKVVLYQSFGIKVSTSIEAEAEAFNPANYALVKSSTQSELGSVFLADNDKKQPKSSKWIQIESQNAQKIVGQLEHLMS